MSKSGLVNSRMTVPGFTCAPGRRMMFSTRPELIEVIKRFSSGTSVPAPRTLRTMEPRLTVSYHSVLAATLGAAGRSRITATVITPTATSATPMKMARRIRFFLRMAGSRLISIPISVHLSMQNPVPSADLDVRSWPIRAYLISSPVIDRPLSCGFGMSESRPRNCTNI